MLRLLPEGKQGTLLNAPSFPAKIKCNDEVSTPPFG
jgi:hypothetical protein